jgi:IclR family acetate operon transcriptional repressor
VQLVTRTLTVLRHLGEHTQGETLNDLAAALRIPSPTLHRLLSVLISEDFVVRSSDKRYALGPAALSLANGARPLTEVARAHLQDLARMTQETVFVTELIGDRAVCVALVEGTRPLRLFVRVGQELPMHAAASARAILSQLPDAEVARLIGTGPLTSFTPDTPSDLDQVRSHLEVLRARGYDVCDEELDLDVIAISAPILSAGRSAPASVTIAAPRERVSTEVQDRWAEAVKAAAAATSNELGTTARTARQPARQPVLGAIGGERT